MINKHELIEQMRNGVVTVSFTKLDGTERVMKATLLAEYLPQSGEVLENSVNPESLDYVRVWDVEKKDWRSFRFESVKQVLTE